ncbi:hypothetical protein SDC9_154540 [bioreactor metagenome]|uniref:Uncharacterized protein n=1 Tax=bioreactor metagenome TaxID=1076179 RepID=A0A645F3T7_9ZZZZ
MVEHLGDDGGLVAGQQGDGLAHLGFARSNAAPEHAAALRCVGGCRELLHPLHREGQRQFAVGRCGGQRVQQLQQARAFVARPARSGVHHVDALERRHWHRGAHGDACGLRERSQLVADVGEGQCRVFHGIELVHREDQRRHAQQVDQQRVAAGLRQQVKRRVLPVELGGVHQHDGGVGA